METGLCLPERQISGSSWDLQFTHEIIEIWWNLKKNNLTFKKLLKNVLWNILLRHLFSTSSDKRTSEYFNKVRKKVIYIPTKKVMIGLVRNKKGILLLLLVLWPASSNILFGREGISRNNCIQTQYSMCIQNGFKLEQVRHVQTWNQYSHLTGIQPFETEKYKSYVSLLTKKDSLKSKI